MESLSKHFESPKGVVKALDSVSFVARPGRVFGLLGVNGAGKTTCLRILSTILNPTSGSARVGGRDVQKEGQQVRQGIGFLSNSAALYGRLTGRQALEYFGGLYGLGGQDLHHRIDAAIERFQMGEFIDRLCDKLSTGQKQRISISRATLHDPPVVFFDEPTAGLDVVMAQTILEFIGECRSQGKTVVFSTHIMSEVDRLCDDVVIIHEGRARGHGTPEEIKQQTGEKLMEQAFLKMVDYRSGRGAA